VTVTGVLQLLGAIAVTFGLLALTLRLLGKLQAGGAFERRGVPMRVLQRLSIGPRQGVALVQVAERVLVVSLAEGGLRLLAELDEPARAAALRAAAPRGDASSPPRFSIPLLGKIGLPLALALLFAPLAAHAQGAPPAGSAAAPVTKSAAGSAAKPAAPRSRVLPIQNTSPAPAPAIPAAPSGLTPLAVPAFHVTPPAPPRVDVRIGEGKDALHLDGAVGLVVFLGVLTLLPAMFLLMTSFTRILIVLHFLRSALGTQTVPPGQLLVAMSILLTGVVMNPVLQQTQREALQPYFEGRITQVEAYQRGIVPFREFMIANTRERDLAMFTEMSGVAGVDSIEQVPTVTVVSAFIVSELRTAFQMGFVIFLPFVVVDLIVASVLMSLGMFMLPPVMISLPFKLLLFVLADGWTLVVQNLVASFRLS
jgi:flagellar biosynthetic protein FliP